MPILLEEIKEEKELKKEEQESSISQKAPPYVWIGAVIVGFMYFIFWRAGTSPLWYIVLGAIFIYFIFTYGGNLRNDGLPHSQAEAMAIVHGQIKRQLEDGTFEFGRGELVMTGVAAPVKVDGDWTEIRVPFKVVKEDKEEINYLGIVHPYEDLLLGVWKLGREYKGDEKPIIKYIVPIEDRLRKRFDRGRM